MNLATLRYLFAATSALVACGELPAQGQLVLHVTTDAPVPGSFPATQGLRAPVLFDRLRLSVLPPGFHQPCPECERDFVVDRALFEAQHVSMGIVLPPGVEGYRGRAQLYLSKHVVDDEVLAEAALQTVVDLPSVEEAGVQHVTVSVLVDDLGTSIGTLEEPAHVEPGKPDAPPGPWPHAERVPCSSEPRPGEVCVPGGAFWMGSATTLASEEQPSIVAPKLVVISPFFLDQHEVRVAELRSAAVAQNVDGRSVDPIERQSDSTGPSAWCTFTTDESDALTDELPVSCISRGLAQAFCRAKDSELPTEAQLAYVNGGLTGSRYVWGEDEPSCPDAVYARAGLGPYAFSTPDQCRTLGSQGGPAPVLAKPPSRDLIELPTGVIHHLAGNLAELARDDWQRWDGPCWQPSLLRDPWCQVPSELDGQRWVTRGGSWLEGPYALRAASRDSMSPPETPTDTRWPAVGFRCARPDPSGN